MLSPLPLRLAMRYRRNSFKGYAMGKLLTDPVYQAVHRCVGSSDLPILDIGCGPGLCAFHLRAHGHTAPILGIDSDAAKIHAAQDLAARHHGDDPTLRFRVGDGADPAIFDQPPHDPTPAEGSGGQGHVIMLDVLHYFDPATQQAVLERMVAATGPGAWAILRITPRDRSWRYRLTRGEEWAIHRIGWIKTPVRSFPTIQEVTTPFRAAGFEAQVAPLWGWTPFNSYLFAFRRPV